MPAPTFQRERHQFMREAIALSRRLSHDPSPQQRLRLEGRLQQLWQKLQPFAHEVQTQMPPQNGSSEISEIPLQVRSFLGSALALLPHYATLIDPTTFYGTLASPTLSRYQPVRLPQGWPGSMEAITSALGLPAVTGEAIARERDAAVVSIARHRRVMAALKAQFNGLETAQDGYLLFQQLFSELLGDLPIPAEALRYLGTEFQLIFALDEEAVKAVEPLDGEGGAWANFLTQMQQFSFRQFARFPSFGHVDASGVNPELIERLVEETGVGAAAVQRILEQSIGIVPAAKAEAFLIHDVWGHGWQLLLTGFVGDYALLAQADLPLTPGLAAYTPEGPLALRQLFSLDGTAIGLDEALAREFFRGEAQQRLGHLCTHLVAELLADVQEYQWIWQYPEQAELLPSSSLFQDWPAKLDLTLQDVDFFFPRILEPLLSLAVSPTEESSLEQSLLQEWGAYDGGTRGNLKGAIAQLQSIFWQEYLMLYGPEASGGEGWLSDFLGNLLQVQHSINELYRSDWARQELPFQAVMLLFVGAYCSGDCYRNFWNLDDDLARWLIPSWRLWLSHGEGTVVIKGELPS